MNKPERRYTLNLKVGADSYADLQRAIRQIEFDLWRLVDGKAGVELERPYECISGGPVNNWILSIWFDPDMNHDTYFNQLDDYLAQSEREASEPDDTQPD